MTTKPYSRQKPKRKRPGQKANVVRKEKDKDGRIRTVMRRKDGSEYILGPKDFKAAGKKHGVRPKYAIENEAFDRQLKKDRERYGVVTDEEPQKTIELQIDLEFTGSQQMLVDAVNDKDIKYIINNWSRQQGKTTICTVVLIKYLLHANKEIGYVTPTKSLSKKIYNAVKGMLEPQGVIKSANGQDLTIESITGSKLYFFSSEQADNIRGNSFNYLFLDEAAFFTNDTPDNNIWWSILFPTIKVNGEKIIMISTPNGKQGFFYEMVQKAHSTQGYKYIERTIYDDGLITKEDLEDIKNTIPTIAFEQEFLCKFLDDALTALQGFDKCFYEDFEYSYDLPQWIGIDVSGKGEDDTIMTWVNSIGQVRQEKITGDTYTEKYKKIAVNIDSTKNLSRVYIENNGIGSPMIEEIEKYTNNKSKITEWTTTNETKQDIITLLQLLIEKRNLYFDEAEQELKSQMGTFTYKLTKTKKLTYGARDGFHDDRIMSLGIALQARKEMPFIEPEKKTTFVKIAKPKLSFD